MECTEVRVDDCERMPTDQSVFDSDAESNEEFVDADRQESEKVSEKSAEGEPG